jgi:hypothetical protein
MGGMNAARLARFAFVAGLLLLAGCAATQQHARDLLQVTLYDYSGAIRWNRPDAAARFLDPEIEAIQPKAIELERFQQVQVTGYEVRGSEMLTPERYAQAVEVRLINKHTQAERSVLDRQIWRYDTDKRQWWLTTGLPDITTR